MRRAGRCQAVPALAECGLDTFDMRSIADDLVIGTLTESETELRDHITSLQADVVAYRELAQQGIHALADRERQLQTRDRTIEHQRNEIRTLRAGHDQQSASAREEYRKLRDENRRLRAGTMQADMGRAA